MNTLYIVPTPIGNLEDITLRALRILREVGLIAAEDTRTSRVLLDHYQITTRLTSYHEHNKLTKLDHLLAALMVGDVALISDAGTPGVSDPGYELIRAALDAGYTVVPLPGASAVITALVGSGFPPDQFIYLGFLPKRDKARRDLLHALKDDPRTLIAYENPYRLAESLADVAAAFGQDRLVCVAREMSKLFEEFYRDTAANAAARYATEAPKGEITLVMMGAPQVETVWDEDRVLEALAARLEAGEKRSVAAAELAKLSGWNKRDIYGLANNDKDAE
ncbi:MAG: 16S rRNA (cytidine(1402)-2'-O)-methyltransferase [Phototrophicaceae bacterium]